MALKRLTASVAGGYHWADIPAMGSSVVVVTDNDPDQFKSTGLLNWVRYSKNFSLLSVNPSGGGSTDLSTGSRGEEARFFPFLFGALLLEVRGLPEHGSIKDLKGLNLHHFPPLSRPLPADSAAAGGESRFWRKAAPEQR